MDWLPLSQRNLKTDEALTARLDELRRFVSYYKQAHPAINQAALPQTPDSSPKKSTAHRPGQKQDELRHTVGLDPASPTDRAILERLIQRVFERLLFSTDVFSAHTPRRQSPVRMVERLTTGSQAPVKMSATVEVAIGPTIKRYHIIQHSPVMGIPETHNA